MPIDWNAQPQWWAQALPNKDDYASAEDYLKALQQGSEDTSAPIGQYYDPIGDQMRGGAHTEREQAVRYFNQDWRFNQPNAGLAMQSWIGLHPEAATQAYQAYDAMGNPQVDPALLAMIEQILGEDALVPEQPAPTKPDDGPSQPPFQPGIDPPRGQPGTPANQNGSEQNDILIFGPGNPAPPGHPDAGQHPARGYQGQGLLPGMVNEGAQMNDLMYRFGSGAAMPGSAGPAPANWPGQSGPGPAGSGAIGGYADILAQWLGPAAQGGSAPLMPGTQIEWLPNQIDKSQIPPTLLAAIEAAPPLQGHSASSAGANWQSLPGSLPDYAGQNQSTVDPNYPDFILQRLRQGQKGTPGGGMAPPRMPMGY